MTDSTKVLLLILACVLSNGAGQLLLRAGASSAGGLAGDDLLRLREWIGLLSHWPIVAGIALWSVSTLAWIVVLGRVELSYAYLVGSLNYVVVPLAAVALLGESMPPARLAGMLAILVGVVLVLHGGRPPAVR